MTMIAVSIYGGNKLHYTEWLGLVLAFSGFVYLMLPGVSAPSGQVLILMTIAGVAWGFYTLAGKKSIDPLRDTSFNFLRTTPLLIALALYNIGDYSLSAPAVDTNIFGVALAGSVAAYWTSPSQGPETNPPKVERAWWFYTHLGEISPNGTPGLKTTENFVRAVRDAP